MSRPSDILIEWTEERYAQQSIRAASFVPLHKAPHRWEPWEKLKRMDEFNDIVHECLTMIKWQEESHPVGVMLKLSYPIVYKGGWNGLFKDIAYNVGFLPLLVMQKVPAQQPYSREEQVVLDVTGFVPDQERFTHLIVPSETDAVVVAAMCGIFDDVP